MKKFLAAVIPTFLFGFSTMVMAEQTITDPSVENDCTRLVGQTWQGALFNSNDLQAKETPVEIKVTDVTQFFKNDERIGYRLHGTLNGKELKFLKSSCVAKLFEPESGYLFQVTFNNGDLLIERYGVVRLSPKLLLVRGGYTNEGNGGYPLTMEGVIVQVGNTQ